MGLLAAAGIAALGAGVSAYGTAEAQSDQNRTNKAQAATQSAQSFNNYLAQRGISIQQIAAANPRLQTEWQRVNSSGQYQGGFDQWIYEHLRANPNDPAWEQINSGSAGAANVNLPNWASINGQPAEKALYDQLIGLSQSPTQLASAPESYASAANIASFLTANPQVRTDLTAYLTQGGDTRSVEQWLHDDALAGDQNFQGQLQRHAEASITAQRDTQPALTPDMQRLQGLSSGLSGQLLDGTILNERLTGLQPALDARTAAADLGFARNAEMRAGSEGVMTAQEAAAQATYAANVEKLASLLGIRTDAAQAIYDASTKGADEVYGAQLLTADAYGQSAEQAAARAIAQQNATRARQGFTGTSSGADLLRARTLYDALQQGALVRTGAGETLAKSKAGAGVGLATTTGQAQEADALAQLQAALGLADQLGTARVGNATRQAGILETDVKIGQENATFQNAMDKLNALLQGRSQQLAGINLPYELGSNSLNLQTQEAGSKYAEIDALLKRLQGFQTGQVQQPQVATPNISSVMNAAHGAGGAISAFGSAYGNDTGNQELLDAIKKLNSGGSGTKTPSFTGNMTDGYVVKY